MLSFLPDKIHTRHLTFSKGRYSKPGLWKRKRLDFCGSGNILMKKAGSDIMNFWAAGSRVVEILTRNLTCRHT